MTNHTDSTTFFQQQAFALDAKFNAHRAPNNPIFRTLYIRRRSQLLRDTNREVHAWQQYLRLRSQLLHQRYGKPHEPSNPLLTSLSKAFNKMNVASESREPNSKSPSLVVPTQQAEASRAMVGGTTISENYAFVGVHYIFDQHTMAVTMVKFANNNRTHFCCSSLDGTLSICDLATKPPSVVCILRGHTKAITGFDWSVNNATIVSTSLDRTLRVWEWSSQTCLRTMEGPNGSGLQCCVFQPANNNLLFTGDDRGEIRVANISTGLFTKTACLIGGNVLSLTIDAQGKNLWAGNDRGELFSIICNMGTVLTRAQRFVIGNSCSITSISYRAWISREARDPTLLVNCTDNSIYLFSVINSKGTLKLKRKFYNKHQKHPVRSIFCPLMSFRQGACVVTGSEDSCVYFFNIEAKHAGKPIVNNLQGHACPVLGVSFNYDESLLATSDVEGLVIVWKRTEPP